MRMKLQGSMFMPCGLLHAFVCQRMTLGITLLPVCTVCLLHFCCIYVIIIMIIYYYVVTWTQLWYSYDRNIIIFVNITSNMLTLLSHPMCYVAFSSASVDYRVHQLPVFAVCG